MKFIRNLLARSGDDDGAVVEPIKTELNSARRAPAEAAAAMPAGNSVPLTVVSDAEADSILDKVNAEIGGAQTPVNIWDMEGEDSAPEPMQSQRRRRNKTRLLGYEHLEDEAVTAFDKAGKAEPTARAMFPVGWVVVAEGPGRGTCFTLEAGMSQIGRGDDQAIQLDFGDNSISRMNHAAIVYDPETHDFLLGHGGKKNIVRLNGTPVISNEILTTGDAIHIGETKLRFLALCTEEFNWVEDAASDEELENVAIA
ncbi:MAG: FHA domain-containing protein [Aliishimia sp.]